MDAVTLSLSPLVPPALAYGLGALALAVAILALVRGLKGWLWRALAGLVLTGALLNPALVQETREPLSDVMVLITDDSASMQIGNRSAAAEQTAQALRALAESDPLLDLVEVSGGASEDGTRLNRALQQGLSQAPRNRLAGVIIASDGQIHDAPPAADDLGLEAPVHHVLTGNPNARDRRLIVSQAPRYGLVGDPVSFTLRVEDEGAATGTAMVNLYVDGGDPIQARVQIGQDVTVQAEIANRGPNVVEIEVEPGQGELSLINNRAAVNVTGVRDRLRVLLVTGEPHNGARAWRNLLKSDPSVDLVHFTILRPLDKDDSVPANELALIAFPVFELFQLSLEEFDLVIFDRYRRRGILRPLYFDNIANYVENGGALLVTTGPPFAGGESVSRSPLASVLPAAPTGQISEERFTPQISEIGQRHPVTRPMLSGEGEWGPWFRRIGARPLSGETVLEAPNGDPLLTLSHEGQGRAAILLSDQAWLWARGYEGGGPHDELFRRVAHWLMGEPELDEERLSARVVDGELEVTRNTLADEVPELEIEWPSGVQESVEMDETGLGVYTERMTAREQGLVRLRSGDLTTVTASGPLNPLEYRDLRPDPEGFAALVDSSEGGIFTLGEEIDLPEFRRTNARARQAGMNWAGLKRNNAYLVTDAQSVPLAPGLLIALLALGLLALAWRREGA
ncbi:hypothetical protein OA2633_06354 [Oceanicaulis sp. HTCC2633]|uniref:hypothetical protein n=1 Tax=Oceanicaulis sp. HTCC2633 TaxID=314254 RepID=UPI000066A167|nr:hypothetical protein [Oceanicaulis sp. HTCC2633]EAP89811.1 hypothetical protein OA2633_06354 [Oceanicaulis sp. HTCC2633]